MRKLYYFYKVIYQKKENGNNVATFDLGTFSTKAKARKKIDISKFLEGFCLNTDWFSIIKYGVFFEDFIANKEGVVLYAVEHEYSEFNDEEWWDYFTWFGDFSTKEEAIKQLKEKKQNTRLGKKYPNNFSINEIVVDNFNSWSEGFNSFDD